MIQELVTRIKEGKFSRKELENLYANAERLGHPEVLTTAKVALKEVDARSYTRKFIKPIRDRTKRLLEELAKNNHWASWEDNKVDNSVKSGGPMLNGDELAEYFIAYRHPSWKRSATLSVFQHDEESAVGFKVKPHDGDETVVESSDKAVELFAAAVKPPAPKK